MWAIAAKDNSSLGDINQVNIATGVRPYAAGFPYLHFINQVSNGSYSKYNSLQVTLTKRLSQGLSFLAGYTYGHGLDNGSLNSLRRCQRTA